jgi:sugar/nucleoside kinase (ribokinase family)
MSGPIFKHDDNRATLCLGEAIVDLICEQPGASFADAGHFAAHLGGVTANTAVFAARAGAPVAIAGAVGDDRWGRWLRERLDDERVDVSLLRPCAGEATQLAFVALDTAGEPEYRLYPPAASPLAGITTELLDEAVSGASALLITSNTLSEPAERALTMHARARALALGLSIVIDCNLRLHRWPSERAAVQAVRACLPGTRLLHANGAEATALTGERDPDRAADALARSEVALVVLTLGPDGVILRTPQGSGFSGRVPPVPVRSAIGAGDAFTGTLLAAVANDRADDVEAAIRAALPAALRAAAGACETWGACD